MKIDLLVAEVGSTTTVVNAFNHIGIKAKFVGQGQSATTVTNGDVNIGLKNAINDLAKNINSDSIEHNELIATSSAAGGLRVTVHGLVYDMTVKAAKEAALGAGANIKLVTAGRLRKSDLKKIADINPNIILIAGGVDYGERDTAIYNSEMIRSLDLNIPIIYAGNIENQEEIREIFEDSTMELYIADNVYPQIDQLNIEPTRAIIQDVFETHIIHAPGMEKIRDMVTGSIMPTPGAVMMASQLLYNTIGDLVTIDIGGATTDIHSVSSESDHIKRILTNPEPLAKRTVEGDLGLYINMDNLIDLLGKDKIKEKLSINDEQVEDLIMNKKPIPKTDSEISFVELLTFIAGEVAIKRHAGKIKELYGPSGKITIAEGKDLTAVKYIIGTGGALTALPNRLNIINKLKDINPKNLLLPNKEALVLIDENYIMASIGVISKTYPKVALDLILQSMGIDK